jgi:hypothetical protein
MMDSGSEDLSPLLRATSASCLCESPLLQAAFIASHLFSESPLLRVAFVGSCLCEPPLLRAACIVSRLYCESPLLRAAFASHQSKIRCCLLPDFLARKKMFVSSFGRPASQSLNRLEKKRFPFCVTIVKSSSEEMIQ